MVSIARLAVCVLLLPVPSGAQPVCDGEVCFVDVGASGEADLGSQSGGVAVLDYNGDGLPDLAFGSSLGNGNRLHANVPASSAPGGRSFYDVTATSGLADADSIGRISLGAIAGDYDGDGDADLYFTGRASDGSFGLLYRNEGGGVFTNQSVSAGVRGAGLPAQSASFVDFDLDGDLDLLVAGNLALVPVRLYVNQGNGQFADGAALLPSIANVTNAYAHLWTDFDDDGDPDCFLLTVGPGPRLLRNDIDAFGARFFSEGSAAAGFTVLGPAPMGIAAGDYDGDGDLDLAISDAQDGTYYRNDGGVMTRLDLLPSQFSWGVAWLDVDNDGDLDHYQAGSFAQTGSGGPAQRDRLFRNEGGAIFQDVSPALNGVAAASRWSVALDYDDDGRVDLVALNPGEPDRFVSVYRNISPSVNGWLKLRLRGADGVSRDALGARVRVFVGGVSQTREITAGSSTSSSEDPRLHFGVGSAATVDSVKVVWPRTGTLAERTETYPGPFPLRTTITLRPHAATLPCQNGSDEDDDGLVDHPADPGCVSPEDPSELPECSDGLDNDADGQVDHPADPQCASPEGPREAAACGLLGLEVLLPLALLLRRRPHPPQQVDRSGIPSRFTAW